jgi:hypothetical protein
MGWKMAARLWLQDNRMALGLPLAGALTVALWLLFDPLNPSMPIEGRIIELDAKWRRGGLAPGARVDLEGRAVLVELPIHYGCEVGDYLKVRRSGLRWARSYRIVDTPHPCSRTHFRN